MVFPDRTLMELAATKPADSAALETIHGIGQAKLQRWGEDFLRVIREVRRDRHTTEVREDITEREEGS
jgi:ATP-dependent DNA helicase RecQ